MNSLARAANQTISHGAASTGPAGSPSLVRLSGSAETNDDAAAALDPFTMYPTTISLIVLMHVLFLYQWQRRLPRKRLVITYQSIVRRKRFHKVWLALLSHPPAVATQDDPSSLSGGGDVAMRERDLHSFSPSVAMGSPDSDRWMPGNGLVQQRFQDVTEWGKRQWGLLSSGSLSGFPLLLYNSHVLWSCRALEQIYNAEDAWRYARCLIALTTLAVGIELCLSHALVQAILRRQQQVDPSADSFGEIQPNFDNVDPSFLGQLRQKVQKRTIGTMTTLAAALLVLFRHQYMEIGVAVLPFFTDRFLSKYPTLAYCFSMAILAVLARCNHPVGVVTGALVGMGWVMFSWDFLADAYHGTCMAVVLLLLTLLSLKGESPHLFPCIDYVSWYDADSIAALAGEPMMRPLSWCFQPIESDDDEESSGGESDDSSIDRTGEALLEFTRVRSDSDGSGRDSPVDPDLLEQGRRPRRTRIRSRRQ